MLVLSRKPGERLLIGDQIVVTVVGIRSDTVRLGVDAPKDTRVDREEIRKLREAQAASPPDPERYAAEVTKRSGCG